MSDWSQWLLTLVGVSFAGVAILALWELRRTAQEGQRLLQLLQQEVLPLIREVRLTTQHVDVLTGHMDDGLERIRRMTGLASQAGQALRHLPGGQSGLGKLVWKSVVMGVVASVLARVRRSSPKTTNEEVRNGR